MLHVQATLANPFGHHRDCFPSKSFFTIIRGKSIAFNLKEYPSSFLIFSQSLLRSTVALWFTLLTICTGEAFAFLATGEEFAAEEAEQLIAVDERSSWH